MLKRKTITSVDNNVITYLHPCTFTSYMGGGEHVVSFLFTYDPQRRKRLIKIERLIIAFWVRLIV